jgi:hypothetical protein
VYTPQPSPRTLPQLSSGDHLAIISHPWCLQDIHPGALQPLPDRPRLRVAGAANSEKPSRNGQEKD